MHSLQSIPRVILRHVLKEAHVSLDASSDSQNRLLEPQAPRSLVALGCQRLESLSCWLCLAEGHVSGADLLGDARMLAEGLCPLHMLEIEDAEAPMLKAFAET
eukprot:m51a1_g13184 hypothetical protein (103) ;mRNA; r:2092-2443